MIDAPGEKIFSVVFDAMLSGRVAGPFRYLSVTPLYMMSMTWSTATTGSRSSVMLRKNPRTGWKVPFFQSYQSLP